MTQIVKLTYSVESNLPIRELESNSEEIKGSKSGALRIKEMVDRKHGVPYKKPSIANRIKNGITGLAKSYLNINLAPEEVIQERQEICEKCIYRNGNNCTQCGCIIKHKTRLAFEACPMRYWGQAVENEMRSNGCNCGKNN